MRSRKASEFEIMEKTFLGGKVSNRFPQFAMMARMTPEYSDLYVILDKLPELIKEKDPLELIKSLILMFGESDSMRGYDELTRLSMIMGELAEDADVSVKIPVKRKPIQ